MNPIIFQAKAALNTFIRLVPIGLYFGTLIMGILFADIRAFILFVGYLMNDLMSYGFRQLFQTIDIPNCAIVQSNRNFYTLPSSHTQTIAFTLAYFFTDMYMKQNFDVVNFIFLGFLLLITMWSRINVGCESLVDGIFATILGILIGVAFYRLTQTWNEIGQPPKDTTTQPAPQVQIFKRL